MSDRCVLDKAMKRLLLLLQEGIPISARPYRALGKRAGLSEEGVIARLGSLQKKGLLKRIDFSMDTRRLGLVSTLVGCRILKKDIARANRLVASYGNITHNYLREHRLNMWFTLSDSSKEKLEATLRALQEDLRAREWVSLPTKRVFKLKLRLHAA